MYMQLKSQGNGFAGSEDRFANSQVDAFAQVLIEISNGVILEFLVALAHFCLIEKAAIRSKNRRFKGI